MTNEEHSDDYFAAAAEVVETARNGEEARQKHKEAEAAAMDHFVTLKAAERKLQEALDKLKQVAPGRIGRP